MKNISAFLDIKCPPHLLNSDQVAKLEKARREANFDQIRLCQMPRKYRGKRFEDITSSGNTTQLKEVLKTYALNRKPVFHFGGYGCGKTLIHSAIAEYCIVHQMPIKWARTIDFLNEIRRSYDATNPENYGQILRPYLHASNCGILFLDDIGVEKVTEWVEEKLYDLIDYVYTQEGCVWFTSNLDISELSERLGQRIADRIFEMCAVIKNTAPNYRLK